MLANFAGKIVPDKSFAFLSGKPYLEYVLQVCSSAAVSVCVDAEGCRRGPWVSILSRVYPAATFGSPVEFNLVFTKAWCAGA